MKKIKQYRCKIKLGKCIGVYDVFTKCVQGYESLNGTLLPEDVVEESPDAFEELVEDDKKTIGWYVGRLKNDEGEPPFERAFFYFDGTNFINRYGTVVEMIYFVELTKKPLDLNNIGDW